MPAQIYIKLNPIFLVRNKEICIYAVICYNYGPNVLNNHVQKFLGEKLNKSVRIIYAYSFTIDKTKPYSPQ